MITIWYDASGKKLRKIVDDRTATNDDYSKDYLDGIELHNGIMDAVAHPEGRIKQTNVNLNLYQVEYQVQDHLGNTLVMFSDLNNNGTLFGATTAQAEIIQVNHYYPFEMNMEGPWNGSATDRNLTKCQYNGKELNQDFGLDWNDYGARWYDATIGRWHVLDQLSESNQYDNPYNYTLNNPVIFIDPTGMYPIYGANGTYLGDDCRSGGGDLAFTGSVTKRDKYGNPLEFGNLSQFTDKHSALLKAVGKIKAESSGDKTES